MPRTGLGRQAQVSHSGVRDRLIDAGVEVLLKDGFLGASARAIAQRAGVATGSVHYHFSSVEELVLAALDRATSQRRAEYRRIIEEATDLASLLARVIGDLAADRDAGRFRLLAQVTAGAAANASLAAAVSDRAAEWIDLVEEAVVRFAGPLASVINARDIAVALVAMIMGLELLDHVDSTRFDLTSLLERIGPLVQSVAHAGSKLGGRG